MIYHHKTFRGSTPTDYALEVAGYSLLLTEEEFEALANEVMEKDELTYDFRTRMCDTCTMCADCDRPHEEEVVSKYDVREWVKDNLDDMVEDLINKLDELGIIPEDGISPENYHTTARGFKWTLARYVGKHVCFLYESDFV